MSSERTIIGLDASIDVGACAVFKLAKGAAAGHPNGWRALACGPSSMPPWNQPGAVQEHGQRLWAELTQHEAVRAAIDVVRQGPPNAVRPLFFKIAEVSDAERLCWEALCDNQGDFVALNRSSPIGRMADSVHELAQNRSEFALPIRMLAVLAALGNSGAQEWQSLKAVVQHARGSGLEIELSLLVGKEATLDAIRAEIQAGGFGDFIRAAEIPPLATAFEDAVAEAEPHLVHFFCHGSTAAGVSALHLATARDFATNATQSSIILTDDDVVQMPGLESTWLVTLNCCESGRPLHDAHSLAHRLVSDRGLPAAVGMLEPVNPSDAHQFTAGFYRSLFDDLSGTLGGLAVGDVAEIEWCTALHEPRRDLCQRHHNDAPNHREWALPLLYVRPERFWVKRVDASLDPEALATMRRKAEMVAGQLRTLPPDAPPDLREALLALLAELPDELIPNERGEFPELEPAGAEPMLVD